MELNGELIGDRILLRDIDLSDVNQGFIEWLSDPETNRFLEVRHNPPDLENQLAYVQECKDSSEKLYLGIYLKDLTLIGSTTLTRHSSNKLEIGLMIGHKKFRSQGLGIEVVKTAIKWAKLMGFDELTAGYLHGNDASARLFSSLGFQIIHDTLTASPASLESVVIRTSLKLGT